MTPRPGRKFGKFHFSGVGIEMPRSCYFARITRPYSDLSGVVARWALRCDKLVIYEHTGSETEKVHIHAAIFGAGCDKKTLKNDYAMLKLKGNEDHSWKEWDGIATAITYMTKGNLDPKYVKGYTMDEINELKAKWVQPKEYEKKNNWQKLFEEFEPYAPLPIKYDWEAFANDPHAVRPPSVDEYTDRVLDCAKKFIKSKDKNAWSPSYPNRVKCCFYSFLWKHKISPSDEWKKRNVKFSD